MKSPTRTKEIQFPNRILGKLITDYADGRLDENRTLYRASVVEIDHVGGKLEETPPNPKNSVRARIITNSRDSFTTDPAELPVYYPFFPFDVMPVKEGEHVYVIFEDERKEHGLWLTRISEANDLENKNYIPGAKRYQENSDNDVSKSAEGQKKVEDSQEGVETPEVSDEFAKDEEVPAYRARVGDRTIEGSNNTLIVLGRDRVDSPDSGATEEAGTIDIVVGRADTDGNVNLKDDESRVYVSRKTNIDDNLGIDAGDPASDAKAVGIKSDEVRIFARGACKIIAGDGKFSFVVDDSGKVTVETEGDIEINTQANATVKAGGDATVESTGTATVKGASVVLDTFDTKLGSSAAEGIIVGKTFLTVLKTFMDGLKAGPIGDLAGIPIPTHGAISGLVDATKPALDLTESKSHKVSL
jgi:hypothetical protein